MADEKKLSMVDSIVRSAAAFGNSDAGGMIGLGLYFLLCFGGLALMIGLGQAVAKWDGHLYNSKGCVALQEVKDKLYSVNSCTGEVKPVTVSPAPATAVVSKSH